MTALQGTAAGVPAAASQEDDRGASWEAPNAAAEPVGPPRWVAAAVIAGAVLLLFYPLHLPYQNPDQDFPVALSLYDFVRGGWSPLSLRRTFPARPRIASISSSPGRATRAPSGRSPVRSRCSAGSARSSRFGG